MLSSNATEEMNMVRQTSASRQQLRGVLTNLFSSRSLFLYPTRICYNLEYSFYDDRSKASVANYNHLNRYVPGMGGSGTMGGRRKCR